MKNIFLIGVTVVAIGAAGYFWYAYMGTDTSTTTTVTRVSAQGQNPKDIEELLSILKTLRSIKIDSAFTNDPVFQSLIDFSPAMAESTSKGRPNPFMPASSVNAFISTSVKSATTTTTAR
jgi:hypothetical protein